MNDMTPWRPAMPGNDDPGRLSVAAVLQAGWPCRWCLRPLHDSRQTTRCVNCDHASAGPE
jgi:hypothetical protein